MALIDAYGLSLVSVHTWGLMWGMLSLLFIVGGMIVSRYGAGSSPLRTLLVMNIFSWAACIFFAIQPWVWLLVLGSAIWMITNPIIEACEQTVLQTVVPQERQGRVVGVTQSLESAVAPLTTLLIGPITHYLVVPFMTTGWGAQTIGAWFGTGQARAMALVFTVAGIIGTLVACLAFRTKSYRLLSVQYRHLQSSEVR